MTDSPDVHRDLHLTTPPLKGPDVHELQHGINQVADDKPKLHLDHVKVDGEYGPHTRRAAAKAAEALGALQAEVKHVRSHGKIDQQLQKIIRHPDQRSANEHKRAKSRASSLEHVAAAHHNVRAKIIEQAKWGKDNAASIHYEQARPMPLAAYKAHRLPITTDCSGYATCCCFAAGAKDPNGLNFDAEGFTGDEYNHCHHISETAARPGDLCEFGGYPGSHVVIYAGNGMCYSHGQEAGPLYISIADEAAAHAGQSVNYLSVTD